MNVETGRVYPSPIEALEAGEEPSDIVEVHGTKEQVEKLSQAVKAQYRAKEKQKAKRKQQKSSRKKNR